MRPLFTKQLAGVGFDQFERIALSDLDLGSADLKRHGPPANRFQPAAFRIAGSGPLRRDRRPARRHVRPPPRPNQSAS